MKYKSMMLLIVIMILSVFWGCTSPNTSTPENENSSIPSTNPSVAADEITSPTTVFDEMQLDMDGDGEDELLQLTSGVAEVVDGYCIEPVLTVKSEDMALAIQPLFANAGYVRPYFSEHADLNADGGEDVLIMYDSQSFSWQKDYCVYGLNGNRLAMLSPEDAYLSSMYEIPNLQGTSSDELNYIINPLDQITDTFFNNRDADNGATLNIRFDGPFAFGDENKDGIQDLKYNVTIYTFEGQVHTFQMSLQQKSSLNWEIVYNQFIESKQTDVLTAWDVMDRAWLHGFCYGDPGQTTQPKDLLDYGFILSNESSSHLFINQTELEQDIVVDYDIAKLPYDYFIMSVVLKDTAMSHLPEIAETSVELISTKEKTKALLGNQPFYEDDNTLIYQRPLTRFIENEYVKMWFETFRFKDNKLVSIELSANTDYTIVVNQKTGSFGSFDNGHTLNMCRFYTLCGYRNFLLAGYRQCTSYATPFHTNVYDQEQPLIFYAGKNIVATYVNNEKLSAEYFFPSLRLKQMYQASSATAASIDFMQIPCMVYDYTQDGDDDILLEIYSNDYFFALYVNGQTIIPLYDNYDIDAFCEEYNSEQLKEDLKKIRENKKELRGIWTAQSLDTE